MTRTLNYKALKNHVKENGDRIQKSGIYFNIYFNTTKITGYGQEQALENYVKEYENELILVKHTFDFMKPFEERKVSEAQFKLRSKFIKVIL
jgi:orotate phosphoribosyltransferase